MTYVYVLYASIMKYSKITEIYLAVVQRFEEREHVEVRLDKRGQRSLVEQQYGNTLLVNLKL
jgi:hypothetical protein